MREFLNAENAIKQIQQLRQTLPKHIGVTAENFFKSNFDAQGFNGNTLVPWRPTKNKSNAFGQKSQGILIASGALKRSIRHVAKQGYVEVFSDGARVPYANIHNNGGTVTVRITEKSRKFFWAMHKKTGDGMWKALALTKKTSISFKMPKRQFIGESKQLNNELVKVVTKSINQIEAELFKTIKR
jgi:phage gpG-like protein